MLLVAETGAQLAGVFLLPLLTSSLSPESYGEVSLVMIIVSLLALVYNPGVLSAAIRMYHATSSEEDRKEIIGSAYVVFWVVPLIVSVAILAIAPFLLTSQGTTKEFYPFIIIALALAMVVQPRRLWTTLNSLQLNLNDVAVASLVATLSSLIFTCLFVLGFGWESKGRLLAYFPGGILLLVLSHRAIMAYSNGKWSPNRAILQLRTGLLIAPASISFEALRLSDRVVIERLLGVPAVGLYSFAYQIGELPAFLSAGIRQLWTPLYYETRNSGNTRLVERLVSLYLNLVNAITAAVILFAEDILPIIIDRRYHSALVLIPVIALGCYFNALLVLTNTVLSYSNKFFSVSKFAIASAAVNIALSVYLVGQLGLKGAAVSTLFGYGLNLSLTIAAVWRLDDRKLIILIGRSVLYMCTGFVLVGLLKEAFSFRLNLPLKIAFLLIPGVALLQDVRKQ